MPFKNEYVPPRDKEAAIEFIHQALADSKLRMAPRLYPHPLEHYSAHEHRMSDFVEDARDKLKTGYMVFDMWTIDHEREMVLMHLGWAREDINYCSWQFIDKNGHYRFGTTRISRAEIAPQEIAIAYRIDLFWGPGLGGGHSVPDLVSLTKIKEAIGEFHRYSLFNFDAYKKRQITLIDGRDNKEI